MGKFPNCHESTSNLVGEPDPLPLVTKDCPNSQDVFRNRLPWTLRFAPPEILQPVLANLLGINHNRIPQDTPLFAQVQWIPSFRAITTSGQCVHVQHLDAVRIAGMKAGSTMLSSVSLLSCDYKFPWHLIISSLTLGLKEKCPIQKYIVGFKY